MANKFSKGHTFVPGEVVDPADLNELVDLATALPALISDQTTETPLLTTSEVLVRTAAGNLRKRAVSTFPSGATSVGLSAAPGTVFNVAGTPVTTSGTLALSLANQTGNKFMAAPVDGTSGAPAFRVISPVDLPVGTQNIGSHTIDWSLGSMFMKQLFANETFIFTNASPGQTIRVLLYQSAASHTVAWPATPGVRWPHGTNPVMTPNGIDIYTLHYIGGIYYGTFDQNFAF